MSIKPKNGGIEYRYDRAGVPKLADGKLSGRAAPFDQPTMIGKKPWGFRETVAKGAFMKSINDGDVVLLDNHQSEKPIARQSAGTLVMEESKGGLDWDAQPANTTYARDVQENAKAGNYGGCSFGFEVVRDTWHYNKDDDVDERTLLEVKLHEISVCTFPAYADGTSVSARDMVDAAMEARDRYYFQQYAIHLEDSEENRANNKPYGNVSYADPKNGKYPVDTKAHAKAAWSYINKPKNAAVYPLNGVSLSSVKSKIKAACKKFGIKISSQNQNSAEIEDERMNTKSDKKSGKSVTLKGGRKTLAKVREILFDECRADYDPAKQLAKARQVILADLVKRAARSNTPAVSPNPNNGVGTGAANDMDADDPVCPTCNGSGCLSDGITRCPGGCAGTGRLAGAGDNHGSSGTDAAGDLKGSPKGSDFGLGLNPGANSDANVPTGGSPGGSGNPVQATGTYTSGSAGMAAPSTGAGSPGGAGNAVAATGTYSKDFTGESREDGQPDDASTDPEGDADVARRMRAVARAAQMRREMADAEASK